MHTNRTTAPMGATGTTGGMGTTSAAPATTGTNTYRPSFFQRLAHPNGGNTVSPTTTGTGSRRSRRARGGAYNPTDTTATTGGLTGGTAGAGMGAGAGVGGVGGGEKLSRRQKRIPSMGDKLHGMAKTIVGTVTMRRHKVVEGEAMMQGRDVKTSRFGRRNRRVL